MLPIEGGESPQKGRSRQNLYRGTSTGQAHLRNQLHRMAIKCGLSEESKKQLVDVRRLYIPQQGLPQRSLIAVVRGQK
jgi:hypothetical protein